MEKFDFQNACIEACKLIEQQIGIKIPLVKDTVFTDSEWGLFIKRSDSGIISAHLFFIDDGGDLYSSAGWQPRLGFQSYDISDVKAIQRKALDQIQELKERVNRKETDDFIAQQRAIDNQ